METTHPDRKNDLFMSKYEFDMDDEAHPCNCFICNDKKKHLNDTIKDLPDHITQNIVYFIGCKSCLKSFEMLDLLEEIHSLKKQRNKKGAIIQLEIQGDRLANEREQIWEEHDENNFTY